MKNCFYVLFSLLILTEIVGCKSVHKITDKDNSTLVNNRKKATRKIQFIDGIEITPGSVVKSKHKPATTKSKNAEEPIIADIPKASKINIEKINQLQFKYAIILDTYIENIANTNLYLEIDEW